ncbi:Cation/H(+) antiporter 17 [Platanthera guangdongensis]|uniref:Cation/H(+) antiporter 17 n=1 Tax=Platanthera guangdongensis TaxID=2320717 RepID=A0ABR2MAM7_9ASPA
MSSSFALRRCFNPRRANPRAAVALLIMVIAAAAVKIVGSVLAALYMKTPFNEGISLGLLMDTKGVVELIMLNIGWDKGYRGLLLALSRVISCGLWRWPVDPLRRPAAELHIVGVTCLPTHFRHHPSFPQSSRSPAPLDLPPDLRLQIFDVLDLFQNSSIRTAPFQSARAAPNRH